MPVRSIFRASPLVLGLALAACGTDVNQAYTAPGWYLEIPRQLFPSYPNYVAGPMSYEDCEVAAPQGAHGPTACSALTGGRSPPRPDRRRSQPIVIRLALPPAAAVLVLSDTSLRRNSNG